jgi:predicted TIM-barrel fold metal-dependent hydrolase
MVESNFPVDRMVVDYPSCMEVLDRATATLDPAERAAVFHGTAIRTYGLDRFGVTAAG